MPKKSPGKATLPSAPPDVSSVTLMKIGAAVAAVRDVSTLLKTIVAELQPVFGFRDVGLFVINEAEDYHLDLVAETPEISPSEGSYLLLKQQLHQIPHRDSLIDWMMQQIDTRDQAVLFDFKDLMTRFPDYPQWEPTRALGYRDCLATSLRVGGELIGMFCINALRTEVFTHVDRSFFQAVADLIAVAVSNVLANEEVLRQKQRVEQLLTISQAVTQIKDRKQLLKTIYERIKPIFPYDSYGLFVLTEDGQYHYELLDTEIMGSDASQLAIERQYGAHHRYTHADSPIEAWMQQGPGLSRLTDYMNHDQAPLMYEAGIRQIIAGPLSYGGEQIGMLCFNSHQKDCYSEADLPLFEAIAEQMSVAVANVLANEEVLTEKAKVERLHFVSEAMSSIQEREQLTLAFDRIRRVFSFDSAGLFVLTEDGQQHYELLDSQTLEDDPVQQQLEQRFGRYARFAHPNSPIEEMMQAGRVARYDFSALFTRYPDYPQREAVEQSGLRQLIAAPLRQGKEVIGLLNFNSQQADRFGEADVAFMQAVAEQMSTVVSNILANEREQEEQQFKETLLSISEAVASIQDKSDLLRVIFDRVKPIFRFYDVGLFVLDEQDMIEYWAVSDPSIAMSEVNEQLHQQGISRIPLRGSALEWLFLQLKEESPIVFTYTNAIFEQFPDYYQWDVIKKIGYRESLITSLKIRGREIGFLAFNSLQENYFWKEQLPLFQAISDQLAVAVSNVLANEDIQRRERFKTLQVELMRIFEVSYELKNNYQQAGRLLQAEIPYDLFVALRFETDSYQLQGGSYFYADQAGEGHWLREHPLLEGEVTNEQLLQGWCQDVEEGVRYLNGKDFAECLPPHAPVREAYRHLGVRSGLLGRTVLNADSSLLIGCFSYHPEVYGPTHQHLLHRLLPTFRLVTDRSLAHRDVQRLTERLKEENTYLEEEIKLYYNFGEMVGESEALRQAFEQVQQVAATDSTVLILGETGTGKELVARAIHEQSPHREKTLIKINCAALPPQLIESELFGHERGAFTGAVQRRIGKFELAHGSTLFLDEIGELPLELQAKLLRVLQEKVFERLGSNEIHKTDARIVAATNRDLEAEVRQGTFRADLFYRLNVFPIHLPPLRQRSGDIPLLAQHFVNRYARKFKKPLVKRVAEETLRAFSRWSFPGNVRELEHLIERAVILAKQAEITVDLPSSEPDPADGSGSFQTLRDHERELILQVLKYTHGKVRGEDGAAAILDIKPTTLESRMERLGIQKQVQFR